MQNLKRGDMLIDGGRLTFVGAQHKRRTFESKESKDRLIFAENKATNPHLNQ